MADISRLGVREVRHETSAAVTLVLEDATDAGTPVDYRPGQFLTLRIPCPEGAVARCYSLSSSPVVDRHPAVTVKRVEGGRASNWICDNAVPGMLFDVLAPAGAFVPRTWEVPFLLVAAGSGITPIMSILRTALAAHGNPVTLVYANTDEESVIFRRELDVLAHRHADRLTVKHWFAADHGLPPAATLGPVLSGSPGAHAYLCGPGPFMQIARATLIGNGIDESSIHAEVFVSLQADAFTARPAGAGAGGETATATVELDGEIHAVEWPRNTVLLDVLLDLGLDAPYVCREGTCGGCAYTLRDGVVELRENHTLDAHDLARGTRLACQSVPRSDNLDVVFDL